MVVGVLRLTLFLPENHSLKGKRQVLRAIKDRVRNKFNVSIAESDGHDMWQRAELGICQVGSDRAFVDSALREVVNFIDSLGLAPLGEEELGMRHDRLRRLQGRWYDFQQGPDRPYEDPHWWAAFTVHGA